MFIVKSVNPKNKIISYFADYIDIPVFGKQVQITNNISEAKVFESNGEAAQAANAMGKHATIEAYNKLATILDFNKCKALVKQAIANHETCVILCPNYSINVQSKYEDGEALQFDLDELEQYTGYSVEVSDYNDLIVDLSNTN